MPPEPLILAFDTSAAHCAAALLSGGRVLVERREEMTKGQAERLFPLLEEILKDAGVNWKDLTRITVGVGPGNFTGIRISVSAARGLALSLGVPAVGVSSFDALTLDLPRPVIASVDARAGRHYLQGYDDAGAGEPITVSNGAIPADYFGAGQGIVGHDADLLAGLIGAQVLAPIHPLAVAIARIGAKADATGATRPAPYYMRPADAAPPRDAPPVILP